MEKITLTFFMLLSPSTITHVGNWPTVAVWLDDLRHRRVIHTPLGETGLDHLGYILFHFIHFSPNRPRQEHRWLWSLSSHVIGRTCTRVNVQSWTAQEEEKRSSWGATCETNTPKVQKIKNIYVCCLHYGSANVKYMLLALTVNL